MTEIRCPSCGALAYEKENPNEMEWYIAQGNEEDGDLIFWDDTPCKLYVCSKCENQILITPPK